MSSLEPLACRHPVLSAATLNYRGGCGYRAEYRRNSDQSFTVTHTVTGEQCLVRDLLLEGNAVAMCTVVAPWAMYRGTFLAEAKPTQSVGEVRVAQEVPLRTGEFEPPIKMQPAIVIVNPPAAPIVLGEEHGVDEIWHGAEVELEKGAILTDHPWWETILGESILRVVKAHEDELAKGSYEVSLVPQRGFYFQMKVSPELFDAMHHPGSDETNAHVRSLYAAAFAEGLIQLREDYKNPEDWREHTNLRSLYTHLKQQKLPTWDRETEDEKFRPNQIVAGLAPHKICSGIEPEPEQGELL